MNLHELDLRRLLCPMPVIRVAQAVEALTAGDRILARCTDPGVLQDIPAWCRVHGHRLCSASEDKGLYLVELEVGCP
jgi:tRNA 2-thiouridine synthesizing protein A